MTLADSGRNHSKTIVSITPLKVQADSRTFKQAASVARFGYHSIVVEGQSSEFDADSLPFQLLTVAHHQDAGQVVHEPVLPTDVTLRTNRADYLLRVIERLAIQLRRQAVRLGQAGQTLATRVYRALPTSTQTRLQAWLPRWYTIRQAYREFMISEPVRFVKYVCTFFYNYGVLPLTCTPKASLYYLHAFYQFPAVYLLCLRYRARFIYDAHDFYSQLEDEESLATFWGRWIVPFELKVETWCMKKAAAVVTVNEGIATLIHQQFGRSSTIMRNAHDLRLDQPPAQHLREQLRLSSKHFLLVSVGHAKPGMAIDTMLETLLILPSTVHVAFLGNGYEPFFETVSKLGLESRVHFVPPVKPDEVVPFIHSADASIILYYSKSVDYQYSLPNRFFQSIAAELPLLYPELPEIQRLADAYSLGLVIDPQFSQSIRTAVTKLIDDPNLVLSLKHNLQVAKEALSWECEEVILSDLLSQCLTKT